MPVKSIRNLLFVLMLAGVSPVTSAAEEDPPVQSSPEYVSLGDAMVLNLATDSKRLSFLQLQADVLVSNDEAKSVVESHIPAIRHKLIVMLSEQPAIDMKTPAKREKVRQKVTSEVRVMLEEMADNKDVEEILFTTFLIQ